MNLFIFGIANKICASIFIYCIRVPGVWQQSLWLLRKVKF